MPRLEVSAETKLAPSQVVAALTDFSADRPKRWTGISPEHYEVYSVDAEHARVREGTKQGPVDIWAIERYDWSTPNVVSWTVEESNFCTPGSYVKATITPRGDGGSRIHCEWERTGTSPRWKLMLAMLRLSGGKAIVSSIRRGMANYEKEWLTA